MHANMRFKMAKYALSYANTEYEITAKTMLIKRKYRCIRVFLACYGFKSDIYLLESYLNVVTKTFPRRNWHPSTGHFFWGTNPQNSLIITPKSLKLDHKIP